MVGRHSVSVERTLYVSRRTILLLAHMNEFVKVECACEYVDVYCLALVDSIARKSR